MSILFWIAGLGGIEPVATTDVTTEIQFFLNGSWVNVLDDTRASASIVCEYGIEGNTPLDRIASTGRLDWVLDNSTLNGLQSRYSPLHTNKRSGFNFNIPVRYKLSSGTVIVYKFLGSLSDIVPMSGVHEEREVVCSALDWMDDAANLDLPDLSVQFLQRADQLITTILDALPVVDQPINRHIDLGSEVYEMALDGGATGQVPKLREQLNQIALSELGYIYLRGDSVTGGVFTFENRHRRSLNLTPRLNLVDIDRGGITVPGSRSEIYSRVQVIVRPTRIDDFPTTVLYSLQTTSIFVQPGETNSTLFGPYRDPNNNDQIGGTDTIDPAPITDYMMNASSDNTGADLTSSFVVTASRSGVGVRFSITNTGGAGAYITKLQQRGKGVYRYNATVDVTVPSEFNNRAAVPYVIEMPYQSDLNVAADVGYYTANILAVPFSHIPNVRFLANNSAELMTAALLLEIGDRIHVIDEMTGVNDDYIINKVHLELVEGGILWCTWGVTAASSTRFWFIGVPGASEIGETTVLGF